MTKQGFEEFKETMSHFLTFSYVEDVMDEMIQKIYDETIQNRGDGRPSVEIIDDMLGEDDGNNQNLKTLIALSGGSLELMRRIVAYFGTTLEKVRSTPEIRRRVAAFIENPETEPKIPRHIRRIFTLPEDWVELLKNEEFMEAKASQRNDVMSTYAVRTGFAVEKTVKNIVTELGYACVKGSVLAVDNKEVDVAIPDMIDPRILVMISYSLTTSSAQTQRANEQSRMFDKLQSWNRSKAQRNNLDCLFVNVIDGGGWLARGGDLRTIFENCDHCYSMNTLDHFREMVFETMEKA